MFLCRHCGLYAHADWTAAVIIRPPTAEAYVRSAAADEWQSGYTPDVLTVRLRRSESSHPAPAKHRLAWS